jgi:hypothetical protein
MSLKVITSAGQIKPEIYPAPAFIGEGEQLFVITDAAFTLPDFGPD